MSGSAVGAGTSVGVPSCAGEIVGSDGAVGRLGSGVGTLGSAGVGAGVGAGVAAGVGADVAAGVAAGVVIGTLGSVGVGTVGKVGSIGVGTEGTLGSEGDGGKGMLIDKPPPLPFSVLILMLSKKRAHMRSERKSPVSQSLELLPSFPVLLVDFLKLRNRGETFGRN